MDNFIENLRERLFSNSKSSGYRHCALPGTVSRSACIGLYFVTRDAGSNKI